MKLFKSKKQIAELKELPLLSATKNLHQRLRLSRLEIVFSITQRQPYRANVKYQERPTDWENPGAEITDELIAENWPELIDKVTALFETSPDD